MANPIPLTTNPSDPESPKGAVPVDIYGIDGGGGADIDWADIEVDTTLLMHTQDESSMISLYGSDGLSSASLLSSGTANINGGIVNIHADGYVEITSETQLRLVEDGRQTTVGDIIDSMDQLSGGRIFAPKITLRDTDLGGFTMENGSVDIRAGSNQGVINIYFDADADETDISINAEHGVHIGSSKGDVVLESGEEEISVSSIVNQLSDLTARIEALEAE